MSTEKDWLKAFPSTCTGQSRRPQAVYKCCSRRRIHQLPHSRFLFFISSLLLFLPLVLIWNTSFSSPGSFCCFRSLRELSLALNGIRDMTLDAADFRHLKVKMTWMKTTAVHSGGAGGAQPLWIFGHPKLCFSSCVLVKTFFSSAYLDFSKR